MPTSSYHPPLLSTSRLLTEEQAGGHGNRWEVFAEDTGRFIAHWLPQAVEKSQVVTLGVADPAGQDWLIASGELRGMGLLYADRPEDAGRAGLLSVIAMDVEDEETGQRSHQLWSAYPFFAEGIRYPVEIQEIGLYPNRLEARLELAVLGMLTFAFDSLFYQHRGYYTAETPLVFSLAALAYHMEPAREQEVVLDDPDTIRKFRARQAWVEEHGSWSQEEDEEASLAAWQPHSPEDLKPIRIATGQMTALLPGEEGPADEAFYQGRVTAVEPQVHVLFGVSVWRVDVVVAQPDDGEFILPFYVAESIFPDGWRPGVGDQVSGTAWIQGYWTGETPESAPGDEGDVRVADEDDSPPDPTIQAGDGPIDWPDLPLYGYVRGRMATTEDLDSGWAVFLTPEPGDYTMPYPGMVSYGEPVDVPIPQYALHIDWQTGELSPGILIQAETSPMDDGTDAQLTVYGVRTLDGRRVDGEEEAVILLGVDRESLRGHTPKSLACRFAPHYGQQPQIAIDCRPFPPPPVPRELILPLPGWEYGLAANRVATWHSRLVFGELAEVAGDDLPAAYRVIDLVRFPWGNELEYRYENRTLADLVQRRAELAPADQTVFDRWLASEPVQQVIQRAATRLARLPGDRAFYQTDLSFYSRLERYLARHSLAAAPAGQWRATLLNACRQGLSRTELDWSRLLDYLAAREGGTVSRADLLAALDLDRVRIVVKQEFGLPETADGAEPVASPPYSPNELNAYWYGRDATLMAVKPGKLAHHYAEWRMVVEDDPRCVPSTHFTLLINTVAHLRATRCRCRDRQVMLFIDEAQAEWPTQVRQGRLWSMPTPYQNQWIDLAAKTAVLLLIEEWGDSRLGWITGSLAQELHLDGPAPSLVFIYDELLPRVLRRLLKGSGARFGETTLAVYSRDWQYRYHGQQGFAIMQHGEPTGECYRDEEEARSVVRERACQFAA